MKKIIFLFLFLLTTAACQSHKHWPVSKDKPSEKIKVLIVDGFSNHNWKATTQTVKDILEKSNLFTVTVSTVPGNKKTKALASWNPRFEQYDVVIQNCNNISNRRRWPAHVEKTFEQYMRGGGGLYILHSANNAFKHWKEYNRMIGLGWRSKTFGDAIIIEKGKPKRVPKGKGRGTSHGKRTNPLITRLANHPIHKGLPRQFIATDIEIYTYARGPAKEVTVLSYAMDPRLKINFPIEWTVKYHLGRVYASSFGHYWPNQNNPPSVRCVAFQTLLVRGVEWLARGDTSTQIPKNFPTAKQSAVLPMLKN